MNLVTPGIEYTRAGIDLPHRLDDPAIHRHSHSEWLEGRTKFINAERGAVEPRFRSAIAGVVEIELRQRGHRQDLAGMDVHHHPGSTDRREMGHRISQFMLQRLLDPAGNAENDGLPALRRIAQSL